MIGTLSSILLTVLAIVVLVNAANGTLGAWFKAKFLHITPTKTGKLE